MSSAEESPAQRAARQRRERREAKIKEGGASRLDRITNLSGRTPSKDREDASPSSSPQPPSAVASPSPEPRATPQQAQPAPRQAPPPPSVEDQDPNALREQQDVLRALLRQPDQSQQGGGEEEDPTLRLLNSLMGGIPGAAQGASANANAGPGAGEETVGGLPPGLASSLGLPPWMSSVLGSATKQESEQQKKNVLIYKILHIAFSVALGIYLVILTSSSVATYGRQPPPPATAQNPFLYFTTGEVVLGATRVMLKNSGPVGPFMYIQLLRDFIRDGSIVLFLFGMGSWWYGGW